MNGLRVSWGVGVVLAMTGAAGAKQAKVQLCHATGSATNPWVLITIAQPAASHHLHNHGDVYASEWHPDADGDGFGAAGSESRPCPAPGLVENADDCDDSDAGVHPDAPEVCGDGADQDCSGAADEGCCPCFSSGELDALQAAWAAEEWSYGSRTCADVDHGPYSTLHISFYGERYGNGAAYEYSKLYTLEYDAYGSAFCVRYHHRYDFDGTGFVRTGYEDSITPITPAEDAACRGVITDWSAANGLVCE